MTQKWFKAADVCEMAELQPYVLRSWEKEFPGIGVQKSADSPRLYRQSDVEQVQKIKQLVFGEGLTLSGARRRLEESGAPQSAPPTRTSRKCSKRSRRMRGRASRACAMVFVRFSNCCRARRAPSSSLTTIGSSRPPSLVKGARRSMAARSKADRRIEAHSRTQACAPRQTQQARVGVARPVVSGLAGQTKSRDVAQPGSALDWGSRGRRFESCHPDQSSAARSSRVSPA